MTDDKNAVNAPDFRMCQICGAGMLTKHAAAHIALHRDAGDLIREAHRREIAEATKEHDER